MAVLMFILGTIFGSFYLVLATRLPNKEDVIVTRSRCDSCKVELKWYNLIPLFSYLIQRGKCSNCGEKITSEHFWVELATGLLFLLSYIYFPIGYDFYLAIIIVSIMMIIFVSDFKYMIILDSPLVVGTILIIILKLVYFDYKAVLFSVLSGISLSCIMLMIQELGTFLLKKESLGGGDIKFSFFIGLCLNLKLGAAALVLSTFLALPYAIATLYLKENHEFPYGPFLSGALFIVFFHYDKFNMLIDFLFPF